jgi:hypothetical protein
MRTSQRSSCGRGDAKNEDMVLAYPVIRCNESVWFIWAVVQTNAQAFMREYGLGKKEWLDAAGQAINIEAAKLSTPRKELHSLSCWQDGRLYINCYEGSMVRIAVVGEKPVGVLV